MSDMKFTGMSRPVDELGRIVIPKEIRKMLSLTEHDKVEIYMEGESIILRKFETRCALCGRDGDFLELDGKNVCTDCVKKIRELTD